MTLEEWVNEHRPALNEVWGKYREIVKEWEGVLRRWGNLDREIKGMAGSNSDTIDTGKEPVSSDLSKGTTPSKDTQTISNNLAQSPAQDHNH